MFGFLSKLIRPLLSVGQKAIPAITSGVKSIGSKIGNVGKSIKQFFTGTPKTTPLKTPLLGEIPNPSQLDKIRGITEVMPVKQSWQAIRESGKAIGGVSKRGAGGLTKAQRIAQETARINKMGKGLNQAEYITEFLQL